MVGVGIAKQVVQVAEDFLIGTYEEHTYIIMFLLAKGVQRDGVLRGLADVLEYVQYSPKKLVRTVETWVTKCVKEGKISVEEGKEFLSNYRSGLYGYTYLE